MAVPHITRGKRRCRRLPTAPEHPSLAGPVKPFFLLDTAYMEGAQAVSYVAKCQEADVRGPEGPVLKTADHTHTHTDMYIHGHTHTQMQGNADKVDE